MPKTHAATLARPGPRIPVARKVTACAGPPVAASPLTLPRLDSIPRRLTVERDARTRGNFDQSGLAQLDRFTKSGFLKPDDTADSSEKFIELAVARAFPPAPLFKVFDFAAEFVFRLDVLEAKMDTDDSGHFGDEGRQRNNLGHSWLVFEVGGYAWCTVGAILPYVEAKWPGFGGWLCTAMESPFAIGPRDYLHWVGQAEWMGESDESLSAEEQNANADTPEDQYCGPTRKGFDAMIPKWAQQSRKVSAKDHATFLRLAWRLFDVDLSPLFSGPGEPFRIAHSDAFIYPSAYFDAYYRPVCFGWKNSDMVQEAIDYCFNQAMQGNGVGSHCAAIKADNIKDAVQTTARIWRAVTALDKLASGFNRYRKERKLV